MVNGHVTRGKSLNVDEQTCQEKNPNDAVALYTAWMETPPPPPPELFSIEEIIIAADSGQRYISDLKTDDSEPDLGGFTPLHFARSGEIGELEPRRACLLLSDLSTNPRWQYQSENI